MLARGRRLVPEPTRVVLLPRAPPSADWCAKYRSSHRSPARTGCSPHIRSSVPPTPHRGDLRRRVEVADEGLTVTAIEQFAWQPYLVDERLVERPVRLGCTDVAARQLD